MPAQGLQASCAIMRKRDGSPSDLPETPKVNAKGLQPMQNSVNFTNTIGKEDSEGDLNRILDSMDDLERVDVRMDTVAEIPPGKAFSISSGL